MGDQFIHVIVSEINNASIALGYGYTVGAQNSPNRKQYNQCPLVLVCPSGKNTVYYPSFCGRGVKSTYDCFLINNGDLASNFNDSADNFETLLLELFMPCGDAMYAAGAWQTRVNPKYDFDRGIYREGYLVTCVEIEVSWIS